MKRRSFFKAGFWTGIGLIGGITSVLFLILGITIIVFVFSDTKDKLRYYIPKFLSSKKEQSISDKWYINSFTLCEQDLLKKLPDSSYYKRIVDFSTIGDSGYRKLLMWRFEVNNSITGSDLYSVNCVVDKVKKSISINYSIL